MLSIYMTQSLEETEDVIYFFCLAEDERRNSAAAILRSLIWQLIRKRPALANQLAEHFETPERTQTSLTCVETLWKIFARMVQGHAIGSVYCVLDGLDECDFGSRRWLTAKLMELFSPPTSGSIETTLRLAIVSREIGISRLCGCIKLDPDNDQHVSKDIKMFVSNRVQELSSIDGFSGSFRQFVEDTLLNSAEGTFLWVGFAINELLVLDTVTAINHAIRLLPSGLPAIYARMLLEISPQDRQLAARILRLVALAVRPLSLDEIGAAIGIQVSSQIDQTQSVRDQVRRCGYFLKLHGGKVSLVHQSTRDYLFRTELDSNKILETFRVKATEGHLELAQACLLCLERSGLENVMLGPYLDHDGLELLYAQNPFLKYAMYNWPKHVTYRSTTAELFFQQRRHFFDEHSLARHVWWLAVHSGPMCFHVPKDLPPLAMACFLGLVPWVRKLIRSSNRVRKTFGLSRRPDTVEQDSLYWAARMGRETISQMLLDHGADVNAKSTTFGRTALHGATQGSKAGIVSLLFTRGADVNARDEHDYTPLFYANATISKLLLKQGAKITISQVNQSTAIDHAVMHGNLGLVRMLLSHAVDAVGSPSLASLPSAARAAPETIVRPLLDHSSSAYGLDQRCTASAMRKAVLAGEEEIVRLLLAHGVDINVKFQGETAFHAAIRTHNNSTIRLLLSCEPDIDIMSDRGMLNLHFVVKRGQMDLARLLLEAGANVDIQDSDGWTALHWAAVQEDEADVGLLLDYGASTSAKDKYGRRALDFATEDGQNTIVKLLLEHEGKIMNT